MSAVGGDAVHFAVVPFDGFLVGGYSSVRDEGDGDGCS